MPARKKFARRLPRVVVFTPGLMEVGGAAKRSRLLVEAFEASGWEVRGVTRAGASRSVSLRRTARSRILEVPGFGLGRLGAVPFLIAAVGAGGLWGRSARLVLAVQPSSPGTAAAIVGRLWRVPTLISLSTSGDLSESSLFEGGVGRARTSLHSRTRFLAQTEFAAGELLEALPNARVSVVPNPVEDWEPWSLTGEPHVAFLGRFSEEKDLAVLLRAWLAIAEKHADARLVLAGSGGAYRSTEDEVRRVVAAVPLLTSSVALPGWVDAQHVLRSADVFVLPSHSEGMSNALLEACAAGRVAVAAAIPQNLDLLGKDYPLLFAPGSAESLRGCLELALFDSRVRAEARRAALSILPEHRPARVVQSILEIAELDARRARH